MARRLWTTLAGASVAALVATLGGCGDDGATAAGTQATSTTQAVSTTAASPEAGEVPVASYAEPEPGLVDVTPAPIESAVVTADPTRLLVTYWGGVDACYGLDHVEVEETPDVVRVEVHTGTEPDAGACIQVAKRWATAVELDEPLGERRVVDAAAPPTDSSTTTSTAPTSSTTAGPRPPETAEAAARAFVEAWAAGDDERLASLGAEAAVADAQDAEGASGAEWRFERCGGAAGSVLCTWASDAGTLTVRVANTDPSHPVVGFSLDPA